MRRMSTIRVTSRVQSGEGPSVRDENEVGLLKRSLGLESRTKGHRSRREELVVFIGLSS